MGALAALSPDGGGAQWGRALKKLWDSTGSCSDVAQGSWAG